MTLSLLRPKFEKTVAMPPASARDHVAAGVDRTGRRVVGDIYSDYVELRVPREDEHFWSPQLKLVFYPGDDGGTRIDGRFGPNPNLWTLFLAAYVFSALIAGAGGLIGLSQWMLDQTATGFWMGIVGTVGFAVVFVVSRIGQYLASDQMDRLRAFVDERFDAAG